MSWTTVSCPQSAVNGHRGSKARLLRMIDGGRIKKHTKILIVIMCEVIPSPPPFAGTVP